MKRECGDCQLCCKLLPVKPLGKKGGEKCKFQKFHKGCTVYHGPEFPAECGLWNCRWLVNDDVDMPRPDRSHYVIDMLPDEMRSTNSETGEVINYLAIQIWVDPAHWDDVMRDRQLFDWVERKARDHGTPTLLRRRPGDAVGVIPPSISGDGKWHFGQGEINPDMGLWK